MKTARFFLRMLNLLGAGILVFLVFGATFLRLPTPEPVSYSVTPAIPQSRLVCPGSLMGISEQRGNITFSSLGEPRLLYAQQAHRKAIGLRSESGSSIGGGGTLLRGDAQVTGAQTQAANTDAVRGLAAASCRHASVDTWLVGGSTAGGENTLLVVANPVDTDTSVTFTVYAAEGKAAESGVVVAAQSMRIVSLTGIAPGLEKTVVHVKSDSVPVYANLQQSAVKGVAYSGATSPAKKQYIPGVLITENTLQDSNHPQIFVRVFLPGEQDADVSIGVVAEAQQQQGTALNVRVRAGVVSDIPISGLAPASYFVSVSSSEPLVAAARSTVALSQGEDFSWYTGSVGDISGDVFIAVPQNAVLALQNTLDKDQEISIRVWDRQPARNLGDSRSGDVSAAEPLPDEGAGSHDGGHAADAASPTPSPYGGSPGGDGESENISLERKGVLVRPVTPGFYLISGGSGLALALSFSSLEGIASYTIASRGSFTGEINVRVF